ncbi:hypothetical protein EYX47_02805 [Escherichia coli]|nr:hypothetical protein [Escherichia coli]EFH1597405.1 hypothetical protein [Escherichia coli]EFH7649036.1 hypothetical protein [Escherichia coli]EFN4854794.1 hypothetical protein [Escherichia coli]EGN4393197.1 hypothetical protein [Escherichia coli]
MAVKISGVLKDGTGKPVQNCTIQLKAKRNSTAVVVNTLASENPDEAGRYSMDVEYGQYSVILLVEGFPPSHAGTITVYEDSRPGTLNDFLGAMTEDDARPEALRRFELMVAGTNEFIGEGDAYIPPHTGLPANSTDIAPPDIPAGFVAVFNSDEASWHLVEDHRGKTVYDVASGDALFISELGPLPENVTWLSPEGEFQKWNGTAWVKDTEAEKLFRIREAEETKNNLMQVASEHIAPLQDAADLEIATEEEISLLEAWKKYRVLLNRVDTSTAQDIEWPALP